MSELCGILIAKKSEIVGYKDATRSPKSVAAAFISLRSFVELNEEDQ